MGLITLDLARRGISSGHPNDGSPLSKKDPPEPCVSVKHILECKECNFASAIPGDHTVNSDEVIVTGKYLRALDLTVEAKDFFAVRSPPAGNQREGTFLEIRNLHRHMLSHCDPLFLTIALLDKGVAFKYSTQPQGYNYVRFSGCG